MNEAEPSSPAPPPRVEWQVQIQNRARPGVWENYGEPFGSLATAHWRLSRASNRAGWTSRLVRRVWRLESEEVVEG